MDIGIHRVNEIKLGEIRQYDNYQTRDIEIISEDGDVTITLYSAHFATSDDMDEASVLKVKS
jgi:predicted membrane protein